MRLKGAVGCASRGMHEAWDGAAQYRRILRVTGVGYCRQLGSSDAGGAKPRRGDPAGLPRRGGPAGPTAPASKTLASEALAPKTSALHPAQRTSRES